MHLKNYRTGCYMVKASLEVINEKPRESLVLLKPFPDEGTAPESSKNPDYSECVICIIKSVTSHIKGTYQNKTDRGRQCLKRNCIKFSSLARMII